MTQEHEKKKTEKQREGLWQRVPKSALLNFGALFIMFFVVFILHRYGDRIIKEESKDQATTEISAVAPQQEAPKVEEEPKEQVDAAKQEAKKPEPVAVTVKQEKPVKIISLPEREIDAVPKQEFKGIPRAVEADTSVEELDGENARQYYLSKTGKYIYTSNQKLRAQEQVPSQRSVAPVQPQHSDEDEYIPFERSGK